MGSHEEAFAVGARVEGNWNALGAWYPGRIDKIFPGPRIRYAIQYDDGDYEERVLAHRIKLEGQRDDDASDIDLETPSELPLFHRAEPGPLLLVFLRRPKRAGHESVPRAPPPGGRSQVRKSLLLGIGPPLRSFVTRPECFWPSGGKSGGDC